MLTPLRKTFDVVDREGAVYPLSLEIADFSFAQREIGIPLVPFGQTEFWSTLESDPIYANVVLLYCGLRRAKKGIDLNWIIDRFPTESLLGPVQATLNEALEDFSQRIAKVSQQQQQAPSSPA